MVGKLNLEVEGEVCSENGRIFGKYSKDEVNNGVDHRMDQNHPPKNQKIHSAQNKCALTASERLDI